MQLLLTAFHFRFRKLFIFEGAASGVGDRTSSFLAQQIVGRVRESPGHGCEPVGITQKAKYILLEVVGRSPRIMQAYRRRRIDYCLKRGPIFSRLASLRYGYLVLASLGDSVGRRKEISRLCLLSFDGMLVQVAADAGCRSV